MWLKISCVILILNPIISDSVPTSGLNRTEKTFFHNCAEATSYGIYEIVIPNFSSQPVKVVCDPITQGGGWLIIFRREDGSVNFYRNWNTYKKGFGDLDGEFFLGLDKIHALTAEFSQELLVILEDFEGNERYEKYEKFGISAEEEQYALNILSEGSGTAGDSLQWHQFQNFSTFDRNNIFSTKNNTNSAENCAVRSNGAWWYRWMSNNICNISNLTGKYNDTRYEKGVNWYHFKGDNYSLKRALMMIRPRQ